MCKEVHQRQGNTTGLETGVIEELLVDEVNALEKDWVKTGLQNPYPAKAQVAAFAREAHPEATTMVQSRVAVSSGRTFAAGNVILFEFDGHLRIGQVLFHCIAGNYAPQTGVSLWEDLSMSSDGFSRDARKVERPVLVRTLALKEQLIWMESADASAATVLIPYLSR